MNTFFFELPTAGITVVANLVLAAIPTGWTWVDGILAPPDSLERAERILRTTAVRLGRTFDSPVLTGTCPEVAPDLVGLFSGEGTPACVRFERAGVESGKSAVTLQTALGLARVFLGMEYIGQLDVFYDTSSCGDPINNRRERARASCSLILQPWNGCRDKDEAGPQPSRVRVAYFPERGGCEEDVASILAVCRDLNLRAYVPNSS